MKWPVIGTSVTSVVTASTSSIGYSTVQKHIWLEWHGFVLFYYICKFVLFHSSMCWLKNNEFKIIQWFPKK